MLRQIDEWFLFLNLIFTHYVDKNLIINSLHWKTRACCIEYLLKKKVKVLGSLSFKLYAMNAI